ncbi:heterokaryon incompatibility protein-domain-containing protein [Dendryphion nanum]|uniref:Heterokaryon incompatibility protein-domain-containing protein n=1 Tax=Dendryphion nanum TaxID=256645 RepID=A0A9P9DR91_9PLEO|nr:heterokaryon incompatibility protein-domain-containing protein [Dendryphion nanum]
MNNQLAMRPGSYDLPERQVVFPAWTEGVLTQPLAGREQVSDHHPSFRYSAIDANKEFRTLIIEPAHNYLDPLITWMLHQAIWITSNNTTFGSRPIVPYEAISYTWGLDNRTNALSCNNEIIHITENVETMLRHLRSKHKTKVVWVDSICIDQSNEVEKARQVQCMGLIFGHALKVRVWLGSAVKADRIDAVFDFFRKSTIQSVKGAVGQEVGQFFTRPWFSRRWVLQEIALAHDLVFHCGVFKITGDWMISGIAAMRPLVQAGAFHSTLAPSIVLAMENITGLRSQTYEILELMYKVHQSECKDNRDRIYALIGFAQLKGRPGFLSVDYSNPWWDTYISLAVECMIQGKFLSMLISLFAFGSLREQNPSWPSWVPSWNKPRAGHCTLAIGQRGYPRNLPHPRPILYPNGTGLQINGVISGVPRQKFHTVPQHNSPNHFHIAALQSILKLYVADTNDLRLSDLSLVQRFQPLLELLQSHGLSTTGKDIIHPDCSCSINHINPVCRLNTFLKECVFFRTHFDRYQSLVLAPRISGFMNDQMRDGDFVFKQADMFEWLKPKEIALILRPYDEMGREVNRDDWRFSLVSVCWVIPLPLGVDVQPGPVDADTIILM